MCFLPCLVPHLSPLASASFSPWEFFLPVPFRYSFCDQDATETPLHFVYFLRLPSNSSEGIQRAELCKQHLTSGGWEFFFRRCCHVSFLPNCFLSVTLQAMAIINGSLYVFGGTTGYIYSTDLHKLDLNTREWIQLKPNNMSCDMPEER